MSLTLEGDTVLLAPLTEEHVNTLLAIALHERANYLWTSVPRTREGMTQYVRFALEEKQAGRVVPFVTTLKKTNEVVGSTRFLNLEHWSWPEGHPLQRTKPIPDGAEIGGTWLRPDVQRTAVNTEAKLLMLTHAFAIWRVHRVSIRTDSRNTRSRNAIERLGATLDGVLRAHMPGFDGQIRNTASYSILRSEWPDVRTRLQEKLGITTQ